MASPVAAEAAPTGRWQHRLRLAEGAAFGAALQALWSHRRSEGEHNPLAELVLDHVRIDGALSAHPADHHADAYRAHYRRFLGHLEDATR